MINLGVPEHVIQRLFGHASADMTARYARLHDTTLRQAFDDYCERRVNIAGEVLDFDADAPTADAEWVKHAWVDPGEPAERLLRPAAPAGLPAPERLPHLPDFQTTPEFLAVHREQAEHTRLLIATAETSGQFRLLANHRRVLDNLERIIPALEAIEEAGNAG